MYLKFRTECLNAHHQNCCYCCCCCSCCCCCWGMQGEEMLADGVIGVVVEVEEQQVEQPACLVVELLVAWEPHIAVSCVVLFVRILSLSGFSNKKQKKTWARHVQLLCRHTSWNSVISLSKCGSEEEEEDLVERGEGASDNSDDDAPLLSVFDKGGREDEEEEADGRGESCVMLEVVLMLLRLLLWLWLLSCMSLGLPVVFIFCMNPFTFSNTQFVRRWSGRSRLTREKKNSSKVNPIVVLIEGSTQHCCLHFLVFTYLCPLKLHPNCWCWHVITAAEHTLSMWEFICDRFIFSLQSRHVTIVLGHSLLSCS